MWPFGNRIHRALSWFLRRHPTATIEILKEFLPRHPTAAIEVLKQLSPKVTFANMPDGFQRNFEDLDWMLTSNPTNKGLLLLELDEAAFLFRLARSIPAARVLEIGRCHGGSAFLFAVATDDRSTVTSIDIAPQNDDLLRSALEKHGLLHKMNIMVADSRQTEAPENFYDLVLVDGDHSYTGVAADHHHWERAVKPGGYLAFHNAAFGRPLAEAGPGPLRLVNEITRDESANYVREPDVGSLAIFRRL